MQTPVNKKFRDRQSNFRKGNVEISLGYITHSDDGKLIMNGLPEWVWLSETLLPHAYMLRGKSAQFLNPKQLLKEKEVYKQIGSTSRLNDEESKEILRQIISRSV